MPRSLALSVVVLALTASTAQAAPAIIPLAEFAPSNLPRVAVVSADAHRLDLDFETGALAVEPEWLNGRTFQDLSIPGGAVAGEPGEPGVPFYARFIALPEGSGATVTAVAEDVREIPDVDLSPVRDDMSKPAFCDPQAYAHEGFGDKPLAEIGDPGIMRGLRIAALTLRPVQYDAARRVLRVAGRLRVQVRFTGRDDRNARPLRHIPMTPSFDKICQALVVNYESVRKVDEIQNGTWLLITPDNSALIDSVQALVNWRQRKGIPTFVATTTQTGTTTASIKAYIQNAYDTWPNPPEYIALLGDCSGSYVLPTWHESVVSNGEGDFPYTQLDGTDLFPDAHIGRLSVNSLNDLNAVVVKTVGYESTPYLQDPGWYNRACLVGDPSESGYSCVQVMQWIKTGLREMNYTQIDTVFTSPFVSQMSTALNRGDTFLAYRGYYGMSGWSNSNTYALSNGWKMPFATIFTCGTGSFEGSTALSEGFLRAGSGATAAARGAVGAIGVATLSTHTRFNNALMYGCYEGMFYEGITTMGAALTRAKLELYLNYITGAPTYVTAYSYWPNLMGDPAGEIWTGFPETLSVSAPAQIPIGSNSVTVTVSDAGSPAAGVQVCLWMGAATYVVGLTDDQGKCELPVTATSPGQMLLTVTKHNCHPYLATIPVGKAGAFLGYMASTIDDDNSGTSQGNGDGLVNPGEHIEMPVRIKNTSSTSATGVTAYLATDDPLVTITDDFETFNDVAVDSSRWSLDDFDFTVDASAPNGHVVTFGLEIHSGSLQWHSLIEVPITAADLVAHNTTLYNSGNGRLDPGETLDLSVQLENEGAADATSVTAQLRSLSAFVVVTDSTADYGSIGQGATVENTGDHFTVSADPLAFKGHLAVLQLTTLFNGASRDTTEVVLPVGQASSTDPVGPDGYGYYAFDNTDITYAYVPTYSWIEIDPSQGGSGTEIPLADYGDYQDKSQTLTMPFNFQYYGENYSQATVCSNGWLAMGSTYLTNYRNWTIPGAGAPENMIAVFWDDLYRSTNGHVYQWFDSTNHQWIVEWSRMTNAVGGSTETFEVILFDPYYYPTDSQDGQIVMQYQTVNNVDSTDGYATVGIENRDHTDGVLYTYFNQYPAGAATLQSGRAIKFVPVQAQPMGVMSGQVTNASGGNSAIPGATVRLLESGRTFTSTADGSYGGGAQEGTYTVVASHSGFAPDTAQAVVVLQGEVTTVNFSLADIAGPTITDVTEESATTDEVGPYPVEADISDFSGVQSASLFYRRNGGSWTEAAMTGAAGHYSADIPGSQAGTQIDYYVRAVDTNGLGSEYPEGAPDSYLSLYITHVTYAYDAEDPDDPNWQLGMTGDTATTGIWIRDDPVGTTYNGQPVQPEDDHTPDPGVKCFVTGNGTPGGAAGDNDVDGGCTTLRSPIFDLSSATRAFVHYWRWFGENGNSSDDEFGIDISNDGGASWVDMEHVLNNEATWTGVSIDITTLLPLTDQMVIRFQACDLGTAGLIEAAVDDFSIEVFEPTAVAVPGDATVPMPLKLEQSRPNPFSQRSAIAFTLPAAGPVKLFVYDVQGRAVRRLVNGLRPAGPQIVFWDGRDDHGHPAPSGLYFYRLDTGKGSQVQKVIRVD